MKKIEIIPIAMKKSERMGISEEWIKEAINSPMQIVEGYGGRKVAHRRYIIEDKEYLLRVIYEEKEGMHVVVTTHFCSKHFWVKNEYRCNYGCT